MDQFLRRLFPGWGGAGTDSAHRNGNDPSSSDAAVPDQHGSGSRRPRRRKDKGGTDASPPPERDTSAIHESLWKAGRIPPGALWPRTETLKIFGHNETRVVTTNVLIAILAAPGVGVRSLIQRVRFGDMARTWHEVPFAVGPPEYLCDGNVYALGMAKLPMEGFRESGLAVCSERMAVVFAYALDSRPSFEAAEDLQRRLIARIHQTQHAANQNSRDPEKDPSPDEQQQQIVADATPANLPPPFPVMFLGLKADLPRQVSTDGERDEAGGSIDTRSRTPDSEERKRKLDSWGCAWSSNSLHAEASARTGDGVLEALGLLVEAVDAAGKADPDPAATLAEMRGRWIPAIADVAEAPAAGADSSPGST